MKKIRCVLSRLPFETLNKNHFLAARVEAVEYGNNLCIGRLEFSSGVRERCSNRMYEIFSVISVNRN